MSEDVGGICRNWWKRELSAESGAARKTRAELKRADTVVKALGLEAVHRLSATLGLRDPARLALIAVALAHIRENGPPVAQSFGHRESKDTPPKLSDVRFNALIRATTPDDLRKPLTRALTVIKGVGNPGRLGADLYYWNDKTRTRWCFDYYGETAAAPMELETET